MKGQTNRSIRKARLQRTLRNNGTDAEREPWQKLRGRQVDGCKFRRQHPFGDCILDFVCLDRKLVIELDGGQHLEKAATDNDRTAALEQAGFAVIRFWNDQVFKQMDDVLAVIWRALRARSEGLASSANPSPPKPSS